jgi:prepilin-type N-terminal cleavage/methylation domain-containing protein
VRTLSTRERFLKDETGFTLPEVLVTTIIMSFILLALAALFDASLKVYSFGNNKLEAVESARVAMDKMEREIRQAYYYDLTSSPQKTYLLLNPANPPTTALTLPALNADGQRVVNQLTFGNDLPGAPGAGNRKIECGSPCEYITYKLTDDTSNSTCTAAPCSLRRVNTANPGDWGQPVTENVLVPGGLSFTLLRSDGTAPAGESQVGMVRISLTVSVKQGIGSAGTQKLTTVVDLRNR